MSEPGTPADDPTVQAGAPTMPAAVYRGGGRLVVEAVPVPDLAPDEVLVEVAYCGVCGSDLHVITDGWGREGWGESGWIGGHEWSGHVRAVGDAVDRWGPGDAVVSGHLTCGRCPACLAGRPSVCSGRSSPGADGQGAFARYIKKKGVSLVGIPDGLDLRSAALSEPLAVAMHAVTRSGAGPGQRALVTGAGPIGALVIVALFARGVDSVTVSEPSPARRELAGRLGAEAVVPADLAQPAALDGGSGTLFDVAIDASGRSEAVTAALGHLRPGSTCVEVGVGIQPAPVDLVRMMVNELTLTGSFLYDPDGIEAALSLLASGRVPVDVLVEPGDADLSSLTDVCAGLASGEIAGKVLVAPG